MKNLFYGAGALLAFAVAFLVIEVSCKKSNAQVTGNTQANKIIFGKFNPTTTGATTVWIANYDGSGETEVPIALPAGAAVSGELYSFSLRLSPDGEEILFGGINPSGRYCIYKCNIDGSNVTEVVAGAANEYVRLGGAY